MKLLGDRYHEQASRDYKTVGIFTTTVAKVAKTDMMSCGNGTQLVEDFAPPGCPGYRSGK
jgi:predicted RNA methylase